MLNSNYLLLYKQVYNSKISFFFSVFVYVFRFHWFLCIFLLLRFLDSYLFNICFIFVCICFSLIAFFAFSCVFVLIYIIYSVQYQYSYYLCLLITNNIQNIMKRLFIMFSCTHGYLLIILENFIYHCFYILRYLLIILYLAMICSSCFCI